MTHAENTLTVQDVQPWLQELFPRDRESPTMHPLAADASTRRYFRVRWTNVGADLPASCVIMLCEPWEMAVTPDFLTVGRHLRASGVQVPQIYGVSPPQGLMCLEDYGDHTLAAQWQHTSVADHLVWGRRAIDELVKMHTVGTQRHDPACPVFSLAFDTPKLLSELRFFRQYAIGGLWQQVLQDTERDALDEAFTALCKVLASQPRYFCHRDYHSWNIMVCGDALGILDFQDARLGPQPYDLVSLLVDRGVPEVLGSDVVAALVDYYLQRMEAAENRRIDRNDFAELFDYVAVQRCLKAVGTFAYMYVQHGRRQYLPHIAPTLTYIKPLLRRYTLLHPLATLLRRYVPLLAA